MQNHVQLFASRLQESIKSILCIEWKSIEQNNKSIESILVPVLPDITLAVLENINKSDLTRRITDIAQSILSSASTNLDVNKTVKLLLKARESLIAKDYYEQRRIRKSRMLLSLNEITIPALRQLNFKGSLPHFRRMKDGQLNLLSFQFSQFGSNFDVEIANCSPNGIITATRAIEPNKCNAFMVGFGKRERIGSFFYETDDLGGIVFNEIAKNVNLTIVEAETWWKSNTF